MDLRPYQHEAVEALRAKVRAGRRRLLLVAPTGSGKTVIAAHLIRGADAQGIPVAFLAHRQELWDQASAKLNDLGIPHAVVAPGIPTDYGFPVQVASIPTLNRRQTIPDAGLVIADEAHHASAESWKKLLDRYPEATVIGLTATPFRIDGNGLGTVFEDWIRVATIGQLTEQGFLVPAAYYAPPAPDAQDIRRAGSDFDMESAAPAWNKPQVTGDILRTYQCLAHGRRGILFACNVAHSQALAQAFQMAGIRAAHLDGETPKEERKKIISQFRAGALQLLTNCGILAEGFDCPETEVVIMARPTASLALYLQMIGRGLRPSAGKSRCLVLDFAGNVLTHGQANTVIDADLSTGITRSRKGIPSLRTCGQCYAVLPVTETKCPLCNHFLTRPTRRIRTAAGELREIPLDVCWACKTLDVREVGNQICCAKCGKVIRTRKALNPKEYFQNQLKLCRANGWKPGRAAVIFKEKFGRWPNQDEKEEAA